MSLYVQTSYSDDLTAGQKGQVATSYDLNLKSGKAEEKINFGLGLARFDEGFRVMGADKVSFDADFVTSNTINGNVTVISVDADGVQTETTTAISQVTYASSHAATLAAVVTAIEAVSGVNAGTGSSGRTITVVGDSGNIIRLSGFVVAAGASQANVSYDSTVPFEGVAVQEMKQPDSNGDVYYSPYDAVNIAKRNEMWVEVDRAVSYTDIPYVRIVADSGDGQDCGDFTTSANAAEALSLENKAKFVSETTGAGLAKIALLLV